MKEKNRKLAISRAKGTVLSYGTASTSLGPVHAACTERGLVSVHIGGSAADWQRNLQKRHSVSALKESAAGRAAALQIREYLGGRRRAFDVRIDWRGMSPFQRRVLRAAMRIPYGRVRTYGEVARAAGFPAAARAAGQALRANPIPLVIPCHRVVARGGLGGYNGTKDVRVKRKLLNLERGNRN
jgi:methylated-DNA-[protein]-cysteine S-methyltransferase